MYSVIMVHVAAGAVALVVGFIALFAAKGATLHRRAGKIFVYAMVVMGGLGAVVAAIRGGEVSTVAGLLSAYMVVTAMTTVRPVRGGARWVDIGSMAWALALGVGSMAVGVNSGFFGTGSLDGIPWMVPMMFGTIALIAGLSDIRVVRDGPRTGPARLARHLWRMCFALWLAAASFFLGQADELPQALRIPALLGVPPLTVLVAMLYWMWRVRWRRSLRGMVLAADSAR